jgi:hypothetical protein
MLQKVPQTMKRGRLLKTVFFGESLGFEEWFQHSRYERRIEIESVNTRIYKAESDKTTEKKKQNGLKNGRGKQQMDPAPVIPVLNFFRVNMLVYIRYEMTLQRRRAR